LQFTQQIKRYLQESLRNSWHKSELSLSGELQHAPAKDQHLRTLEASVRTSTQLEEFCSISCKEECQAHAESLQPCAMQRWLRCTSPLLLGTQTPACQITQDDLERYMQCGAERNKRFNMVYRQRK
jgi:hypothetical protein